MFIPVGEDSQGISAHDSLRIFRLMIDIWQVDKSSDGGITKTKLFGVMVSLPEA
jgi:hypothetical protein